MELTIGGYGISFRLYLVVLCQGWPNECLGHWDWHALMAWSPSKLKIGRTQMSWENVVNPI